MTHREFEGWDEYNRRLKAATEAGSPEWARLPHKRRLMEEEGDRLFFSGVACLRGHVSPRNEHGACTQCYVLMLEERRDIYAAKKNAQ